MLHEYTWVLPCQSRNTTVPKILTTLWPSTCRCFFVMS